MLQKASYKPEAIKPYAVDILSMIEKM